MVKDDCILQVILLTSNISPLFAAAVESSEHVLWLVFKMGAETVSSESLTFYNKLKMNSLVTWEVFHARSRVTLLSFFLTVVSFLTKIVWKKKGGGGLQQRWTNDRSAIFFLVLWLLQEVQGWMAMAYFDRPPASKGGSWVFHPPVSVLRGVNGT